MATRKIRQAEKYNGEIVNVNSRMIAIDPAKFRKALAEKDLNMGNVSVSLGYGASTLSSATTEGFMSPQMLKLLDILYGIKQADIEYIPKAQQAQAQEASEAVPVDKNALYDTMKAAMIDAINEAIAGNMKNLRGMIYTAIYTAVNAAKKEQ